MENINVFLEEVNTLNIISERYYFMGQLGYIPERDCLDNGFDKASLRGYKSKEFMTLNEVKKADLQRTYLGAKTDLILLSNEQLTNARKTLLSFVSKHIYKQLGEFYVKVNDGKQHPSDETDFKYLLNSNFICDIPVIGGGSFSVYFLSNLTNEYMNKRGYVHLLVNDIDNLLNGADAIPQINKLPKYEFEYLLFKSIFDFCQKKEQIFRIDELDFFRRIGTADFSGDIMTDRNKGKIITLIYCLTNGTRPGVMNDNWYSDAVISIGINKGKCSGYSHNLEFKEGLIVVIKAYNKGKEQLNFATLEIDKTIDNELYKLNPNKN